MREDSTTAASNWVPEYDVGISLPVEMLDATSDRDELLAALIVALTKARMMGVTREELIRQVEDAPSPSRAIAQKALTKVPL